MITSPSPVILLADDEPYVRNLIRLILQDDYEVLHAANGSEALDVFRSWPGRIDLLLTDIDMPGMDGFELHRQLSSRCPDILVLFISGAALQAPGWDARLPYLAKPFDADTLRARVRELLKRPAQAQQKAILVVDSDGPRRGRIARILRSNGYAVRIADSAEEAKAVCDSDARIDLVVSAVNMAGDSGIGLAGHVNASDRRISTLLISHAGLERLNQMPGFAEQPAFLENPFTPEVLLARVQQLLDQRQQ